MRIGEFAGQAGLSPSRIRFYEARGLLSGAARLRNGYRDYSVDDLKIVRLVDRARKLGFSLAEIARFMSRPSEERRAKSNLIPKLEAKLAEIDAYLAEVQVRRAALHDLLAELRDR